MLDKPTITDKPFPIGNQVIFDAQAVDGILRTAQIAAERDFAYAETMAAIASALEAALEIHARVLAALDDAQDWEVLQRVVEESAQ